MKAVSTNNAPAAIGPYSQAIDTGAMVFVSGQIPVNPKTGNVESEDIEPQAIQVFENIKAILAEAGLSMCNVAKTTCLLADMGLFSKFNTVYAQYFTEPYPARATFAVKGLPKNVLVEVEVVAVR